MQVEILPAAPLPGSVKVAQRPVKPLVLVRVQVWQPFQGVMSVADGLVRIEEGACARLRCNSCHPDHLTEGRQIQAGCTCPENRIGIAEVGALPTPSAKHITTTKGNPMRPTTRYQSQLLPRRGYKLNQVNRNRPAPRLNLVFRPARAGPQIKTYECETN